jgi:hypothetical protein
MYVAAAGLSPISPVIEVVPVVEIPVFARIAKSPAVPRDTGARPVDVGVEVDVGVGTTVDVGVYVDVDIGVVVAMDVGVCVGVVADVAVGVGVKSVPPQADTSVIADIKMRDIVIPSMIFLFI